MNARTRSAKAEAHLRWGPTSASSGGADKRRPAFLTFRRLPSSCRALGASLPSRPESLLLLSEPFARSQMNTSCLERISNHLRSVAITFAVFWIWFASSTHAAPEVGMPQIVVLTPGVFPSLESGLQQGLQELGYVNGQNVRIDWRRSVGTLESFRSLAIEAVRTKVDVFVTFATPATGAALEVTTTVPVVFLVGDPVRSGFADSLAKPGRNATGVSVVDTDLSAKRLELLRLCVPKATRILYLMNSANPLASSMLKETERAAQTLGMTLVSLDARNADELRVALETVLRSRVDAILASPDPLFMANSTKVTAAVRKARLPGMFPFREYHEDGALMSYGPNLKEVSRRMATYVDRILKGLKPAELPIEQISSYELVIDLRAAKASGITVPQDILLRADEVVR